MGKRAIRYSNQDNEKPDRTSTAPTSLAMMYASLGRYNDAADVLETASSPAVASSQAGRASGTPPPLSFEQLCESCPAAKPSALAACQLRLLVCRRPDHALDYYEDTIKSGLTGGQGNNFGYLWHASYAPVRKTDRFKRFCAMPAL
jgi:hypothetical protein